MLATDKIDFLEQPMTPQVEGVSAHTATVDPDEALLGMSFPNEQNAALVAAAAFQPLSPEQLPDIRRRAALAMEGKGETWWAPPAA